MAADGLISLPPASSELTSESAPALALEPELAEEPVLVETLQGGVGVAGLAGV